MPDVQKNYSFHEQKAMESLEEKGILDEDFCGEVELNDAMRAEIQSMVSITVNNALSSVDFSIMKADMSPATTKMIFTRPLHLLQVFVSITRIPVTLTTSR